MSELLQRLQAKYPHYKVISDPDPDCTCAGVGERKLKPSRAWPDGHEIPCLCVCMSGDHRAEAVKLFADAVRSLK